MEPFDLANLSTIAPWNPNNALASDDPKLQPFLYFDSKQEYLEWRDDWKQRYSDLSQKIRTLRKEWRAEGSNHDPKLSNQLLGARALARTMLALRAASKVRAEALYQQSKATSEVA